MCAGEVPRSCRRGSFVRGSCRFGSQLGASPLLVPRRHLALLHSPHISVLRRPYFLRRPTVRSCTSPFGCGEHQPGAGGGERRSVHSGAGRMGGGRGRAERGVLVLRRALGAASSSALLPGAAAALRPAPPCPLAVRDCRSCRNRGRGGGAGSERRERRQGARAEGECEPRGRGGSDRCSGAPRAGDSPAREGQGPRSARTRSWGAESRLPSSLAGKAGEV